MTRNAVTPVTPTSVTSAPLRVVILNWRDSRHPEGGGSELYVEQVAARLVERGSDVTVLTARYPGSTAVEHVDGYELRRAGGRLSVYPRALLELVRRRGSFDVVVDVQNGVPFWSRLVTRRPVVVLCHHVHREQWHIALGNRRLGRVAARVGWWLESVVAPRVQRGSQYVTVSEVSRTELVDIGVRPEDVRLAHNGTPQATIGGPRGTTPEIVVLGRLVPHKRVELAVRAVAALARDIPDLRLTVIGQGWWHGEVRALVDELGVADRVDLLGFVDDATKQLALSRAWVMAMPSVKEGWGLSVMEAAAHGTPSVAYTGAGGVAEAVVHDRTGLLVEEGETAFTEALRRLLLDHELRTRMGRAAAEHAVGFSWDATTDAVSEVLHEVTGRSAPERPAADVRPDDVVLPTPRTASDDDPVLAHS